MRKSLTGARSEEGHLAGQIFVPTRIFHRPTICVISFRLLTVYAAPPYPRVTPRQPCCSIPANRPDTVTLRQDQRPAADFRHMTDTVLFHLINTLGPPSPTSQEHPAMAAVDSTTGPAASQPDSPRRPARHPPIPPRCGTGARSAAATGEYRVLPWPAIRIGLYHQSLSGRAAEATSESGPGPARRLLRVRRSESKKILALFQTANGR